jgi:hypothetical protein
VRGHHIARLDRFVGQAQRAAVRAGREFEGVSIEVDAQGVARVHAIGMASVLLCRGPSSDVGAVTHTNEDEMSKETVTRWPRW